MSGSIAFTAGAASRQHSVIVNNIKLPINASEKEAFSVALAKLRRASVTVGSVSTAIYKRSIDARHKDDIKFVYSVLVSGEISGITEQRLIAADAKEDKREMPNVTYGNDVLSARPVVVGSGPCGLFCALLLAEHGYMPILIERGGSVSERIKEIDSFKKNTYTQDRHE